MKFVGLVLLASLLMISLVPAASAIPPVCVERTVDAGLVRVTVEYGGGIGCLGGTVETCTLRSDPEHPSTPAWTCRTLVTLP